LLKADVRDFQARHNRSHAAPTCHRFLASQLCHALTAAQLSSDAGVLVLREIEQRLGIAARLAACIDDPGAQAQVVHCLSEVILIPTDDDRFRL
jgi:hypothetical protein